MIGEKKAFLFDLDGTVYVENSLIRGAREAIGFLKRKNKKVFFLTNNGTNSRRMYCRKLRRMGLMAKTGDIFNSAYLAARYLKKNHPKEGIFAVGEKGLKQELRMANLELTDYRNAKVVIVSLDRKVNYEKLTMAVRAASNGAFFLATNNDTCYPSVGGPAPGAGAILSAIEKGCGRKCDVVLGKPNFLMRDLILEETKLKPDECIIVGDNLDTDILAAKKWKMQSVLVRTGRTERISKKEIADFSRKHGEPTYVIEGIWELKSLFE